MSRLSKLRIVDPVLTNLATGYTNAQLVGDQLMPFVYADKEAGKIPLFGKDHFRAYATERALRAKSNRINPADIGSVDVSMDEHDLEYPIDYREDAESSFPLQASATNAVLHGIQLRHELMVAALAGSPVSNDGRGLKHMTSNAVTTSRDGSPVSNDGRGLKQIQALLSCSCAMVRPSAMTGVD